MVAGASFGASFESGMACLERECRRVQRGEGSKTAFSIELMA